MPDKRDTITAIKKLEKNRAGSKVISYFLADSPGLSTRMANDVMPFFYKHLAANGKTDKVSLYLYTTGGDMIVPLKLINLVREFTNNVEVLVPRIAHSAGTLLCLGANKIVMGAGSSLSPVDPTTSHPFNPKVPNTNQPMEVSVEDVNSFFQFSKDELGLTDKEQQMRAFELLVSSLHPLALGNIYRGYRMANILGKKLLSMHMDTNKDSSKISLIVKKLTKDLPVHGYPINRREAKELGLKVEFADSELEKLLNELFYQYETETELNVPFNPQSILAGNAQASCTRKSGIIESSAGRHVFTYNVDIRAVQTPDGKIVPQANVSGKWEEEWYDN